MSKIKVFMSEDWEQVVDTETGEILLEGHRLDTLQVARMILSLYNEECEVKYIG